MKFILALLLVGLVSNASGQGLLKQWALFKKTHSKAYNSNEEETLRFGIWKSNLDYVNKHNREADNGMHTYWLAMNKFADLTAKEFAKIYNGFNSTLKAAASPKNLVVYDPSIKIPDSIDWRTQGYVTPVKDQSQCGSCWAFSTTGSLEGQNFAKTKKLVSLSEQNLVDCSRSFGNQGCNGGWMDQAFSYIKANKGIDTEDSYPYEAVDGNCRFNPANVGATDTGFVDIKSQDEDALKQAVGTVGPVSVAIDASHSSFQMYSHGVYHEPFCSETRLDHGVLVVGYGTESGKDYWIVKNSWSETWGDKGYILMSRNRKNNCGIATKASYPIV